RTSHRKSFSPCSRQSIRIAHNVATDHCTSATLRSRTRIGSSSDACCLRRSPCSCGFRPCSNGTCCRPASITSMPRRSPSPLSSSVRGPRGGSRRSAPSGRGSSGCSRSSRSADALLDDLERRPLRLAARGTRRLVRFRWPAGPGRRRLLVREDHAVPVLARVDPEHGVDGHLDAMRDAGETRLERHDLVAEHEAARRGGADVQNELAIDGVTRRCDQPLVRRVDDDVGRHVIVQYPLVHRTEQIRALLRHRRYWRISCSISVRLAWNDGRENTSSMYRWIGFACGGRWMPNNGRRHRIGAIVQSTSENSSLRKYRFAAKISTLDRMLSSSALIARATGLRSLPS